MFRLLAALGLVAVLFLPSSTLAQTLTTIDVFFNHADYTEVSVPKDKNDDNDYEDACIRADNGPWSRTEVRRKGGSTWQPMGKKPSYKAKKIDPEINFAGLFTSDKVVLNNDILHPGYGDSYRIYREMGIHAPQAYHAVVHTYKGPPGAELSCSELDNTTQELVLADGPHRYTVTQNLGTEQFMSAYYGNCTFVLWEIDDLEMKDAAFKKPDDPRIDDGGCLNASGVFAKAYYKNFVEDNDGVTGVPSQENSSIVAAELVRMKNLSKWHLPSLVRYVAADTLIVHFDGPVFKNGNGYIVRSTRDLNCDTGTQEEAELCDEGGLYYMLPHGIDRTLMCQDKNMLDHVMDSNSGEISADEMTLPMGACRADRACRSGIKSEYAKALESAHATTPMCTSFRYWTYILTVLGTVGALAGPFSIFRSKTDRQRWNPWGFAVECLLRIGLVIMLFLIWMPVPVFDDGRSPYTHYWITRTSEFGLIEPKSSADYDLIGDWQGSLERQAWASALRFNGRVDTRWYYDGGFGAGFDLFYPDEAERDEFDVTTGWGGRTSWNEYVSACSMRNACCDVHRLYLGTNLATFIAVFFTGGISIVRQLRSGRVWSCLRRGSPFVLALKIAVFIAHLLGMVFYYVRNMSGYYCQGEAFDDFGDRATVHYGSLFFMAVFVSFFLFLDVAYEMYYGAQNMDRIVKSVAGPIRKSTSSIYKLIF